MHRVQCWPYLPLSRRNKSERRPRIIASCRAVCGLRSHQLDIANGAGAAHSAGGRIEKTIAYFEELLKEPGVRKLSHCTNQHRYLITSLARNRMEDGNSNPMALVVFG